MGKNLSIGVRKFDIHGHLWGGVGNITITTWEDLSMWLQPGRGGGGGEFEWIASISHHLSACCLFSLIKTMGYFRLRYTNIVSDQVWLCSVSLNQNKKPKWVTSLLFTK